MKIFLSWSGDQSRGIAECFHNWLPKVLQYCKPYMSQRDIKKGDRWLGNINRELKDCQYGIAFLTKANVESPWLNFEAGALSKELDGKLSPVLHGLETNSLIGPLKQFQATTSLEKEQVADLVKSINSCSSDIERLDESILKEIFEVWWPKLKEKLPTKEISEDDKSETEVNYVEGMGDKINAIFEMLQSNKTSFNLKSGLESTDDIIKLRNEAEFQTRAIRNVVTLINNDEYEVDEMDKYIQHLVRSNMNIKSYINYLIHR